MAIIRAGRLLAMLFSGVVLSGTEMQARAESMQAAAYRAVSGHPEVLALVANKNAIDQELAAAKGLSRPRINVEGRAGYLVDMNTDQFYGEAGAKLVQPLYDGGHASSERKRQKERVSSAEKRAEDSATTIALQAVQAYLEVQRSRIAVQLAAENLKSTQAIVGRVRQRVESGASDQSDMEQAMARLYSARDSKAEAELRMQDANTLYYTSIGQEPSNLKTPELPKSFLSRSLSGVIADSRGSSPKILALHHDALAADAAIGSAQSGSRPNLNFELSANYHEGIDGSNAENATLQGMLVMSFDLYDGGINKARVAEARNRAEEAVYQEQAATLSVEREIRLSWNIYSTMKERTAIFRNQAKSNKMLMRLRLDQYEAGTSSLIGVLDAQNESFVAGLQAVNQEYAGRFACYKMLAASGKLLSALHLDEMASAQ